MKKILFAGAVLMLLAACLPMSPLASPTAIVNVAATSQANLQTAVIQTLTSQPTSTTLPPTETLVPTQTLEVVSSPTLAPPTVVPETATAMTGTFVVATSTEGLATLPISIGTQNLTSTPGVLTYGTLPPAARPYSQITLINRAKRQAYISLQVVTDDGPTIIEYPVAGRVEFLAPTGHYLYVAWVGGREMIGEFRLRKDDDLTIILYKDRIEIK